MEKRLSICLIVLATLTLGTSVGLSSYAIYNATTAAKTTVVGPKGDQGPQGENGTNGKDGLNGQDGEKGEKGDTGATGEKGETGATGEQGPKGDKGDTGATSWSNTILPSEHGYTTTSSGSQLVGEDVTFTFIPDASYKLNDVLIDGVSRISNVKDNSLTLDQKEGGYVIKALFVPSSTADFLGGDGSSNFPFLVNKDNISSMLQENKTGYHYYKWENENEVIDDPNFMLYKATTSANLFHGNFDGNGLTIKNSSNYLFTYVGSKEAGQQQTVIENLEITSSSQNGGFVGALGFSAWGDVLVKDVNIHGVITGQYVGSYFALIQSGDDQGLNLTFENCFSDASLVSTSTSTASAELAGGFVGAYRAQTATNEYNVIIKNSDYTGKTYKASTDEKVFGTEKENLAFKYVSYGWMNKPFSLTVDGEKVAKPSSPNYPATFTLARKYEEIKEEVTTFSVDAVEGAVSAKASLVVGPNGTNAEGNYVSQMLDEQNLKPENGKFVTQKVKNYKIGVNGVFYHQDGTVDDSHEWSEHPEQAYIDGDYLLINDHGNHGWGTTYGSAYVQITQFDAKGIMVAVDHINFAKSSKTTLKNGEVVTKLSTSLAISMK